MENYKQASRLKLRFESSKGSLSTEQLWDLSLRELDNIAVSLDNELNQTNRKSFLTETTSENIVTKLKFEVVVDVLNTLKDEKDAARVASERRESNKKLDELIARKKDKQLEELSIEELESMRMS